ncbi:hypothetical protein FVA95_29410 [Pseudonocardia sp. EV170527-09]|uniref:hypothetical protein n=1 Tax=Pseudonocardia sp. EV170527-09 TaxID=2603411 RepID=UPI0011F1F696|nr:hypothetical protein [Pseudonocardia sp. EV170527-09]KAA1003469.1 hypothetical protein FVA95_29410 [Pseudonocardia sp. EV170527-09]
MAARQLDLLVIGPVGQLGVGGADRTVTGVCRSAGRSTQSSAANTPNALSSAATVAPGARSTSSPAVRVRALMSL